MVAEDVDAVVEAVQADDLAAVQVLIAADEDGPAAVQIPVLVRLQIEVVQIAAVQTVVDLIVVDLIVVDLIVVDLIVVALIVVVETAAVVDDARHPQIQPFGR